MTLSVSQSPKRLLRSARRLSPTPGCLAPILVFGLACAIYANTLGAGFVWDDHWLILDNPRLSDPGYIEYLLLERQLWRPLQRISLMLDYALWGPGNPAGFHLTNILLQAGACVALYFFAARLTRNRRVALAASLFFAVHPVHVEAVANISHRKEPMALLFYLLAFLAYLTARGSEAPRSPLAGLAGRFGVLEPAAIDRLARWEMLVLSAAFFLLGMLSKEVAAVMFPVTVLVYELTGIATGGRGKRARLAPLLPLLVPAGLVLAVFTLRGYLGSLPRRFGAEQILWVTGGETSSYSVMFLTAVKAFGEYTRLLFWPVPLYLDRAFPLARDAFAPDVLFGFGTLAIFAAALIWARRRSPVAFFALSWYGLNLLPILNLVPLTPWLLAERFLYTPSAGIALLFGVGIGALSEDRERTIGLGRRLALGLGVVVLASLGLLTIEQNRVWHSNETLWSHTLEHNPDSSRALYSRGRSLMERGELQPAELALRRALEISPTYPEARYALAYLLRLQQRWQESVVEARRYARLEPDDPEPHILIGHSALRLEQSDLALRAFRRAVELDPEHRDAQFNLALLLHRLGRDREALDIVRRELARGPDPELEQLLRSLEATTGLGPP